MIASNEQFLLQQWANELDSMLDAKQKELTKALDPHFEALQRLGVTPLGLTVEPYHEDSFQIWSSLHRKQSDDPVTWHHLAIMHQARAFDAESGESPETSDEDWKASLSYWYRLRACDHYWEKLIAAATKSPTADQRQKVAQLREELPVRLLRLHMDIALHEETAERRRKMHLSIVDTSPFPTKDADRAREEAYQNFTKGIDNSIWQNSTRDPAQINAALSQIEKYLRIDGRCPAAVTDALRLLVRLLQTRATEFYAAGESESDKQRQVLRELREQNKKWWTVFDNFPRSSIPVEGDLGVKLATWYALNGDVLRAMDMKKEALEYYRKGAELNVQPDDSPKRCARDYDSTSADLTRDEAVEDMKANRFQAALQLLNQSALKAPDVAMTYFMRCQCFAALDRIAEAKSDLNKFRSLGKDDENIQNAADRLESQLFEIQSTKLVGKHLEAATGMMKQQNWDSAEAVLSNVIQSNAGLGIPYFLRCQCRLAQRNARAARQDLDTFKRLDGTSGEAGEVLKQLEVQLRILELQQKHG